MNEVSPDATPAQPVLPALPVRFTGDGAGYFGIWIVNLVLTVMTFGIYSAWAKVRRLRYFYRHTEVAGSSFDFHGSPARILLGRVIALVMLLLYNYSVRVRSRWTLVILAVFAIALPWLIRNAFRFRLYNTSWRGTRFHFRGSVAGAYRVFLLNGILTFLSLYLFAPFAHQRLKAYQHDNSFLGRGRFSFHAGVGRFYLVYLTVLGAIVVFGILAAMFGLGAVVNAFMQAAGPGRRLDPRALARALLILYGVLILLVMLIGPLFRALITNLIWSNTRLEGHRIECRMSPWKLAWIGASNFVLVLLTLGLLMPWAAVRLARYQAESMQLLPASDLQEFAAADPESVAAIGEEAVSVFDFDIGL